MSTKRHRAGWVSVIQAAEHLGVSPVSLRRMIDRRSKRSSDGAVEAAFDGIRARKVGRVWRVWLSAGWKPEAIDADSPDRTLNAETPDTAGVTPSWR